MCRTILMQKRLNLVLLNKTLSLNKYKVSQNHNVFMNDFL